jgi:hypothetical protein
LTTVPGQLLLECESGFLLVGLWKFTKPGIEPPLAFVNNRIEHDYYDGNRSIT